MAVLKQMKDVYNIAPDVISYTTVINACGRVRGNFHLVCLSVLAYMHTYTIHLGLSLFATYYTTLHYTMHDWHTYINIHTHLSLSVLAISTTTTR